MSRIAVLRLFATSVIVLLSGCIIIPTPGEEPYEDELTSKLTIGETTKENVEQRLGAPTFTRSEGNLWIYGSAHQDAYLFIWLGKGDIKGPILDYQYLMVLFDNNAVSALEVVEDVNGCSQFGVCVAATWKRPQSEKAYGMVHDRALVTSEGEEDRVVKKFDPSDDHCSLFLYLTDNVGRVAVGGVRNVLINSESYLFLSLKPGVHAVSALPLMANFSDEILEKEIQCLPGQLIFLEVREVPWEWGDRHEIRIVEAAQGKEDISEKRLILLP